MIAVMKNYSLVILREVVLLHADQHTLATHKQKVICQILYVSLSHSHTQPDV